MKYIKRFESYIIDKNDNPEVASDKNNLNKSSDNIKEFLQKKQLIDSIYLTYKDQKDLINKLKSKKLIQIVNNKTTFINPFIGMYAEISAKNRQVKSNQDELEMQRKNLSERQDMVNNDPDNKDSLSKDIDYINSKITDISNKIKQLQIDSKKMMDDINKKIKLEKDNLLKSQKRIISIS